MLLSNLRPRDLLEPCAVKIACAVLRGRLCSSSHTGPQHWERRDLAERRHPVPTAHGLLIAGLDDQNSVVVPRFRRIERQQHPVAGAFGDGLRDPVRIHRGGDILPVDLDDRRLARGSRDAHGERRRAYH
ncbi:hypothetical protein [Streptomyces sp. A012304]|uniref:hypothetical protein n=1 Tax=Streptomyces sp. A012304 TaxID=375446 RepID=UPI002232C4B2|nr:hypothetical protein [Streptomyces sp. A012304]